MWKWMTKKTAVEELQEPQYPNRSGNDFNDSRFPVRTPTVGLYEARLRAANKEAWTTSSRGWSDVLGRFSSKSK